MKKTVVIVLFITGISSMLLSYNAGPLPGNTNAPGDLTCYRSSCHANNGRGAASPFIQIENQANSYTNDDTIKLKFGFNSTFNQEHGFQVLALDSLNNNVGSWILNNSPKYQVVPGFGLRNSFKYLEHTSSGTTDSTWQVEWKTPTSYQGKITFYTSLMASNNNDQKTGDTLYLETLSLEYQNNISLTEPKQIVRYQLYRSHNGFYLKNNELRVIEASVYNMNGSLVEEFNLPSNQEKRLARRNGMCIIVIKSRESNASVSKKFLNW